MKYGKASGSVSGEMLGSEINWDNLKGKDY